MRFENPAFDPTRLILALRRSTLFASLSADAMAALQAQLTPLTLMSGEVLFREGDPSDSLYIVISGRLRVVSRAVEDQSERVLGDLGHGEIVGEMGLICEEPRSATVVAVRDTNLAKLTEAGLSQLAANCAQPIYLAIIRQLASRLRDETSGIRPRKPTPRCLAVVGLLQNVLIGTFTDSLTEELNKTGSILRLNSESVDGLFGMRGVSQSMAGDVTQARFVDWLNDKETRYSKVLYEAEALNSSWTARCLRQADLILLVVRAREDYLEASSRAADLYGIGDTAKKTRILVIVHDDGDTPPNRTREWTLRIPATRHFHIRMNNQRDFARLARFLNDRSVGLALGGGFARGIGHIGAIRAMRELDIPIDMVGGTSMGAIIAAQCAFEWDFPKMLELTCRYSADSMERDYTLPVVSFLTGRKLSQALTAFGANMDIEDMWLPYFCVSANLTRAEGKVHSSGKVSLSVMASSRAPGVFPPVTWDNELLVDGGLVDVVPSDVTRDFVGQGTVISIAVSPPIEYGNIDYGLSFSGWEGLRRQLFSKRERVPGLLELLMRTLEFGRTPAARLRHLADAYLTLPLGDFRYGDFRRGAEIEEIGYRFAIDYFGKWLEANGRPWLRSD
ncbi:MAG: cyclic nucleotide-binding domain-containing protein [Verrucomicrobia bacterium]|nr:cyclic nucleotide-binding domain-containing protein [Verrucomicrobiota bacterium]MBV8481895.1 cyclic nucleotide-binding domain-containing protein [Verrucomicrobiota bacterium]